MPERFDSARLRAPRPTLCARLRARGWAALRASWLLGSGLGLAAPAAAQVIEEEGVRVEFDCQWVDHVSKGYFPVRVHLESRRDRAAQLELRIGAESWRGPTSCEARRSLRLEPRETLDFELLVPAFPENRYSTSFQGSAELEGSLYAVGLGISCESPSPEVRSLLVVTSERLPAGMGERLAALMKTEDVKSRSMIVIGGASSPTAPNLHVQIVDFDALPLHFEAFTSLDGVLLDLRHGGPDPQRLQPLLAWARLGGRVAILDREPRERLAAIPGLEGAFEPRFELSSAASDESARERELQYGTGRLFLCPREAEALDSAGMVQLGQRLCFPRAESAARQSLAESLAEDELLPAASLETSWVPSFESWRLQGSSLSIPGVGELPLRSFLLLLFLFALVIGPFNLAFVRKRKRPGLLLITVPAISILASIIVLAYGILYQGVDIKSASRSLTWLDQRTRRAQTIEERTMFVGLSPGEGLRPGAGTVVLPLRGTDDGDNFVLDSTRGLVLSGSFLPVRDPVSQVYLCDAPARLRLHARQSPEGIEVENSLDRALEGLLLRDADGRWHHAPEGIAPGSKARLVPLPARAADGPVERMLREHFGSGFQMLAGVELPASSYVARVGAPPFADSCGLELNERLGEHVLVGILEQRAEDWE